MDTITFADKSTGGTLTAADVNEIKSVVNANAADKYRSVEFPGFMMNKDTSNPPSDSTYKGNPALAFDDDDTVYFQLRIPEDYKEGTDLKPYIEFAFGTDFTSQDYEIEFTLHYNWANVEGTFATSSSTVTFLDSYTTEDADTFQREFFNDISGTGKTIDGLLLCKLVCNSNSVPDYIYILTAGIKYLSDARGATSTTTK